MTRARHEAAETARRTACVGCRGLVPVEDGPIHRYMTASPGCWRIYTELGARPEAFAGAPRAALTVDAYAVTHPGVPGPQSTPSVWIHLVTLGAILEQGWGADQAVRLRRVAADAFEGWPWLERPDSMGTISAVDVARSADLGAAERTAELVERWIDGAWAAWAAWAGHRAEILARTDDLVARFF